jgi:hypothetical protein
VLKQWSIALPARSPVLADPVALDFVQIDSAAAATFGASADRRTILSSRTQSRWRFRRDSGQGNLAFHHLPIARRPAPIGVEIKNDGYRLMARKVASAFGSSHAAAMTSRFRGGAPPPRRSQRGNPRRSDVRAGEVADLTTCTASDDRCLVEERLFDLLFWEVASRRQALRLPHRTRLRRDEVIRRVLPRRLHLSRPPSGFIRGFPRTISSSRKSILTS